MEQLIIEKNVPAPTKITWRTMLDSLEVSDSFPFDVKKRNSVHQVVSSHFHTETNKRFTISTKDQPKGKARVWRIEDATDDITN